MSEEWARLTRAGLDAHRRRQFDEAAGLLEDALLEAEAFELSDPRISTTAIYFATNELVRGNLEAAEEFFRKTLLLIDEVPGPNRDAELNRATCYNNLGLAAKRRGDLEAAEGHYASALKILERWTEPSDPTLAATRSNIAVLYMLKDDFKAAELLLKEALADETHHGRPLHQSLPTSLHQLAAAYLAQEKFAEAEALLLQCFALWDDKGWSSDPVTLSLLEQHRDLLLATGRVIEAGEAEIRIAALRRGTD